MRSLFKNKLFVIGVISLLVSAGLVYFGVQKSKPEQHDHITSEDISLDNHQKIHVVHAAEPEKGLIIFISDKAHEKTAQDYAKKFADLSYYVAVIDSQKLLEPTNKGQTACVNLAEKLTTINTQLQSHYNLDADELPILVGADDGAAVLYAALAQADKQKFHAAVSINFLPLLKAQSPLCDQQHFAVTADTHRLTLTPVKRLPASFYIFQDNKANPNLASHDFTDDIGNVKLTIADGKDQALTEAIQILQWLDPRLADQISSDASDSNLPLIDVPVAENYVAKDTDQTMAIIITGDGGWAEIDKSLAKILAERGIPTVALDSLSYFWKARTVEETTQDIEVVIAQYLEKWNKKKVIIIGYSFGADVLPFIANNLNVKTQKQIALIALLGMGKTASFEFRLSSWMNADKNPNRLPLLPEIEKMKWANSVCIYGVDDDAANCIPTAALGVKTISMSGDHHFDEKYDELVTHIVENAKPD